MSGNRNIHPGQDGSMDLGFGPDAARPAPSSQRGGPVTLSAEQFDALLGRLGQQEQPSYDYAAELGEEVQQPQQPQQLPQDPIVNMLQDLPDPGRDFEGFKRGLGMVLANGRDMILNDATRVAGQHVQVSRGYDDAWEYMQKEYPDIAQYQDLISDATRREMDELRARGIDPAIAVAKNMEGFTDSIAARVQNTVNRVRGLQDGDDPSDNPGDYARTEMIEGGYPGRRMPAGKDNRPEAPTSLVDDIRKLQRELGIY